MIQPLGSWLRSVQECRIQCAAYGYKDCIIAIKSGSKYDICCQQRPDSYFQPCGRTVTVKLMPTSAIPVDVKEYGDHHQQDQVRPYEDELGLSPVQADHLSFVTNVRPPMSGLSGLIDLPELRAVLKVRAPPTRVTGASEVTDSTSDMMFLDSRTAVASC